MSIPSCTSARCNIVATHENVKQMHSKFCKAFRKVFGFHLLKLVQGQNVHKRCVEIHMYDILGLPKVNSTPNQKPNQTRSNRVILMPSLLTRTLYILCISLTVSQCCCALLDAAVLSKSVKSKDCETAQKSR